MPTKVVLITNPAHDAVTKYLYSWSKSVITSVKKQPINFHIHELKNDKVTKINLTKLIEEKNPHLILFHGHGSSTAIFGFEANILIACDDNERLLENKIIHSLSCDCGKELGPKCVSFGTKAFIGYKGEFKFAHSGETTNELKQADLLAKMFLQPAFEVNKALLEGNSLEQAYKRSQHLYANNLQILLTSNNPVLNRTYASGLYHDMTNQVALGDKSCSF